MGSPLLSLPRELRDQIILPLLLLDRQYSPPDQPLITAVCRQLRAESLPAFYGVNILRLQLDSRTLLAIVRIWLKGIGDVNVGHFRKVEMLGWRRIPFGHMIRRLKVLVVVDLRTGDLDESGGEGRLEEEDLKSLQDEVRVGKERGWDGERLHAVMERFWSACAGDF